ncbi:MAG: hypothetical protein K2P81_09175 [Bacteriovoracaceae bacterium]|nr:hypothetical protein [Bacteriovoracaceae bacterium]
MKKLIFFIALFTQTTLLASPPEVRLAEALKPKPCNGSCVQDAQEVAPTIKKAEVKVTLPCSAEEKLPLTKKEEEKIQFYEPANPEGAYPLSSSGFILRSRTSKDDPTKQDVTLKFRPPTGDLKVDPVIFEKLKSRSDQAEAANPDSPGLEMKCEADVAFGLKANKRTDSCSLTTTTNDLTSDHELFSDMFAAFAPKLPKPKLADYKTFEIASTSWKLDMTKVASNFASKKISVEKWIVNGVCILEASTKTNVDKIDAAMKDLSDGFKSLGIHFENEVQGQKTKKAFEAAPQGWSREQK